MVRAIPVASSCRIMLWTMLIARWPPVFVAAPIGEDVWCDEQAGDCGEQAQNDSSRRLCAFHL